MTENDRDTLQPSQTVNRFFLRHLRENVAKISREELAEALNLSPEKVKHWETGRKPRASSTKWHLNCFSVFPPVD